MRFTAFLAGLFLCTAIIGINNNLASAQSTQILNTEISSTISAEQIALEIVEQKFEEQIDQTDAEIKPTEVIKYTVLQNDTLSKIADKFQTTWQRIYDKNTDIKSPDTINPGDVIIIPDDNEKLAKREVTPNLITTKKSDNSAISGLLSATISGNSYIPGYCTWYAKYRRPDLPNNLGNANTWVSRALQQGLAIGSMPRVGAIGQQGMHVVFVEGVNPNGTVKVSEMNYVGFNIVSSRTVAAGNFQYIY